MAGKASFFPSGVNCKIKVNGVTLAYAVDISYRVSIPHARPKTLGTYEANSLDPLSYDVSGQFTVIRYPEGAVTRALQNGSSPPGGAHNDGNGVGSWTENRGGGVANAIANTLGKPGDGRAHHSLIPSKLQDAMAFDIEVYQKTLPYKTKILPLSLGATTAGELDYTGIARFRNCRIVDAATSLPRRGVMTQTFQFIAEYLDEDSFIADASGIGQQNA